MVYVHVQAAGYHPKVLLYNMWLYHMWVQWFTADAHDTTYHVRHAVNPDQDGYACNSGSTLRIHTTKEMHTTSHCPTRHGFWKGSIKAQLTMWSALSGRASTAVPALDAAKCATSSAVMSNPAALGSL